eukprot:XP_014769849.1 PREDICTED: uncharacterized protein LOC106868899 [Octopus bimaculoides]
MNRNKNSVNNSNNSNDNDIKSNICSNGSGTHNNSNNSAETEVATTVVDMAEQQFANSDFVQSTKATEYRSNDTVQAYLLVLEEYHELIKAEKNEEGILTQKFKSCNLSLWQLSAQLGAAGLLTEKHYSRLIEKDIESRSSEEKADLFARLLSSNSTLENMGAFLLEFPFRTEQVLDSVVITPKAHLPISDTKKDLDRVWPAFDRPSQYSLSIEQQSRCRYFDSRRESPERFSSIQMASSPPFQPAYSQLYTHQDRCRFTNTSSSS